MPAGRPAQKSAPPFGSKVAQLRTEKGWTQPELAKRVGVPVRLLTYYERRAKNPTRETVEKFASALGVSPADLLGTHPIPAAPRKPGPPSELEQLFAQISELPRSKQQAVVDMIAGYLSRVRERTAA